MAIPTSRAAQTLRGALAFAAQDPQRAMTELESGLAYARSIGDQQGVLALARHAAVICSQLGDPTRAVEFYEEAQSLDSGDPYLFLAIGHLRHELKQPEEAWAAFAAALRLAQEMNDAELIGIATDLLRR